ncbi:MAG: GtrA family protein [Burkholderiaceae bacterium]|nr:GtrA family protein [Burkholderiaceae bacterium]
MVGRTGFWFTAVGGLAALTHLGVFALVQDRLWPEAANALGFAVAFGVSFAGHRWLSFHDAGTTLTQSLLRFGATALASFATNEALFMLLLRVLGWPSLLALFTALLLAAGQTFVLSRFWAFRR